MTALAATLALALLAGVLIGLIEACAVAWLERRP